MESELLSTELIDLIATQNEILTSLYANSLFVIGVVSAVFVLFLLYKVIRLFY